MYSEAFFLTPKLWAAVGLFVNYISFFNFFSGLNS